MADRQYHLKFDGSAAKDVDAYLEYRRIVGDDDGGRPFTEQEYEDYKKRVLPQRLENRLYTSWTNSSGMDCKQIGPETPCFCQHRYKQHKTDFAVLPDGRPIMLPCRVKNCRCMTYHYVPTVGGGGGIRCTCKHVVEEHSEVRPYQCKKSACQKCAGFKSSYACGCGEAYGNHEMIIETRDEREARGHPLGMDVPYQAMGGITGFSSLAEGYMRLDPSGRGAPTEEFLAQEITSRDNPILRAAVPSVQSHRIAARDYDRLDEDMAERMSAMRRPGESEMDYYERRYQERMKAERLGKRSIELHNSPNSRKPLPVTDGSAKGVAVRGSQPAARGAQPAARGAQPAARGAQMTKTSTTGQAGRGKTSGK